MWTRPGTMLGGGASRMVRRGQKTRGGSRSLTARVTIDFADKVDAAAAAAGLTRSEYIEAALRRQPIDYQPAIAALAVLMRLASYAAAPDCPKPAPASLMSDAQVKSMLTALIAALRPSTVGEHG